MRPSDSYVRARVDRETKKRATQSLNAMGLSVSDAIRLFMRRVADEHRLPFAVTEPNSETYQAMEELETQQGRRHNCVDDLMADLHADD